MSKLFLFKKKPIFQTKKKKLMKKNGIVLHFLNVKYAFAYLLSLVTIQCILLLDCL